MREQRKGRGCIEDIAAYAVAMLAIVIGLPAAVYIHVNAPQWEGPAVFTSLGLGILPALWYWRFRRYGWVVAILAAVLLATSLGLALFHGWETQAMALIIVAAIALAVFIFVGLARLERSFEARMRARGRELNGDPLFRRAVLFRDDGQRITVYPRRRRLFFMCVGQAAILAALGCAFAFLRVDNPVLWVGLGLLTLILISVFLATLYRLVILRPSLEIGPDGIRDSGSLLWTGVGLVRWDNILAVFPTIRTAGRINYRYLDIMVSDLPAIRKRLPLLKRLVLSNTYTHMSQILIGQSLLETPVEALAEQIAQYIEDHAPPGWRNASGE